MTILSPLSRKSVPSSTAPLISNSEVTIKASPSPPRGLTAPQCKDSNPFARLCCTCCSRCVLSLCSDLKHQLTLQGEDFRWIDLFNANSFTALLWDRGKESPSGSKGCRCNAGSFSCPLEGSCSLPPESWLGRLQILGCRGWDVHPWSAGMWGRCGTAVGPKGCPQGVGALLLLSEDGQGLR